MSSFKNGNNSSDRVDPKMVTPSRHSVFIRGFPSNMSMENVRSFFKTESKENCKIDFFSYSEDRKKLFIALRFESHEKAVDVIENFDNKEVLGHSIEVSWFKDLRKARKQLIEEERANRNNDSRSPVEWNVMNKNQSGFGRNGMYMWPGRFLRNRGLRNMSNFNRQRDCFQRRMFNTRNTGCWRRARLSPNHPGRTRRERSHSNSRSYTRSRSRSRSRSKSYSSKSHRRSCSSFSSRKSLDKSSSNKDIGHDSVHKYRFNRSNSFSSDRQEVKRSASIQEIIQIDNCSKKPESIPKPFDKNQLAVAGDVISPNIVHAYSISPTESSASSNEMSSKMEKFNNKKHKRKSKKKNKKRKLNKKSKDSDDNSSVDSFDDQRCVKLTQIDSKPENLQIFQDNDLLNALPISSKTVKDDQTDINNIKSEFPNLSPEDHVKVLTKKESLEKTYKKDCETVASVAKLMISKNPTIEENILIILKSIFTDIGDKYIEELRSYINYLANINSQPII